nr:DUF58 domain-containing protein [Ramlibacter aurantiacus]
MRSWWLARLPVTDTLALTQRRVYILPTRAGWLLGGTLLVLLIASINYQLNLGYLLTFLLAGSALVGMHLSHGTLRGLRLNLEPPQAQFAGASAELRVVIANDGRSARHGIGVAVHEAPDGQQWAWCDVPAQGSSTVCVAFQPARRGLHRVPALTAETRYPLGTFRVWTVWQPAARVLVWPAPELAPPPLPPAQARAGHGSARAAAGREFEGVRAYRRGDALRQVVWKKSARSTELVSRDHEQARRPELWLDHALAGSGNLEQRLSRLAAWVLQADRLGAEYGLRVPGQQVRPGNGEAHKRHCLEVLALCG